MRSQLGKIAAAAAVVWGAGGGTDTINRMIMAEMQHHLPVSINVINQILGGLFDETFRRSLLISGGDLSVFVSRPVAAVLLMLNMALIMSQLPVARRALAHLRGRPA